nr:MAG TPA: hypothetical protein [Caudoviricetes sp.]
MRFRPTFKSKGTLLIASGVPFITGTTISPLPTRQRVSVYK